jgi:sec-independent protein translocase protein TatA
VIPLALIGNLSLLELLLIGVVAVLVFGRRLPEVAGQAAGQVMRAKRALTNLRRESGIDDELRRARDAAWSPARPARPRPSPSLRPEPSDRGEPRLDPDAPEPDATRADEPTPKGESEAG